MMTALAVFLHHPLVALLFALWSYVGLPGQGDLQSIVAQDTVVNLARESHESVMPTVVRSLQALPEQQKPAVHGKDPLWDMHDRLTKLAKEHDDESDDEPPKNLPIPPEYIAVLFAICSIMIVVSFFACLALPLGFGYVYKQRVTDQRQTVADFQTWAQPGTPLAPDFRFGLCGCMEDINICMHSFCCRGVRAADTHQAGGTEKFWTVLMFWILSMVAGPFVGAILGTDGNIVAGLIMALFMTGKRQVLRSKLGIAPAPSWQDFLLWWCCAPCVTAQEAREVDNASGVVVQCCCSLTKPHAPAFPMVGPAVTAPPSGQIPQQALQYQADPRVIALQPMAAPAPMAAPQPMPAQQQPLVAQVVSIQPPQAAQPFLPMQVQQ